MGAPGGAAPICRHVHTVRDDLGAQLQEEKAAEVVAMMLCRNDTITSKQLDNPDYTFHSPAGSFHSATF
jgi:hypothetical protein